MSNVKDEIKKNIKGAELIFSTQLANARAYIHKERELGFMPEFKQEASPSLPNADALNVMKQLPFTLWLQKQAGYLQAREKITTASLTIIDTTEIEIIGQYREILALERLTALLIHLFTDNKKKLSHAIVNEKKRKPVMDAMRRLRHALNQEGGCYFGNGVKQHLLQNLLYDLLKTPGDNAYSAKRCHVSLLRQIVTTNFAQGLCRTYEKISVEQATNISLDITSIFFGNTMDKRDASRDIQKISDSVRAENEFLNKTVMDVLMQEIVC